MRHLRDGYSQATILSGGHARIVQEDPQGAVAKDSRAFFQRSVVAT